MLVITRLQGETIVIGPVGAPIATIHVSSIRGDRVRIGIDAAQTILIDRGEVAAEKAAALRAELGGSLPEATA